MKIPWRKIQMKANRILLLLMLALHLAAQQHPIFVGKGRTDGGSGLIPCPAAGPAFRMTVGASEATYAGTDGSGTATLTSTTIVEDPPSSGRYVLRFDGTNDDVRLGTGLDSLTDFTVCGWYSIDAYTATLQMLAGKFSVGSANFSWRFQLGGSASGRLAILMQDTGAANERWESAAGFYDDKLGAFHHLCAKLVCTGLSCTGQIYFAGRPITTSLGNDATGTLRDDTTFTVMAGTLGDATFDLDGDIASDLEVWTPSVTDYCVQQRFEETNAQN
jgi:hypothetical protein